MPKKDTATAVLGMLSDGGRPDPAAGRRAAPTRASRECGTGSRIAPDVTAPEPAAATLEPPGRIGEHAAERAAQQGAPRTPPRGRCGFARIPLSAARGMAGGQA